MWGYMTGSYMHRIVPFRQKKKMCSLQFQYIHCNFVGWWKNSTFGSKAPLNMQTKENAVCNIKKHSGMVKCLRNCHIIIWDECIMAHKHSLEVLNRTLKDLNRNKFFVNDFLVVF